MLYRLLILAVITTAICGCSDNEDIQTPVFVFNKPCLQWDLSQSDVKEEMKSFSLLYEDGGMLIYEGKDTESLITYDFQYNKLGTSCVFIKSDLVSLSDVSQAFNGYSTLPEYIETTYINLQTNTVGELTTVEKNGQTYYCLAWSILNPALVQTEN